MLTVSVDEMQRDVSRYLRLVETGETLVITQGDKPFAEVKPLHLALAADRPFGLCAGQFVVPDDFDAPLPEDVLASFEEK